MYNDFVARHDVHRLTGDVITAARILAGRDVRIAAVRGSIRVGVQIRGGKMHESALNAFVACALAVFELRRLFDRVEDDDVGLEHRVVLVIDQKRMSADRHRAHAVEMRALADDLFVAVIDVHVADRVARFTALPVPLHLSAITAMYPGASVGAPVGAAVGRGVA